MTSKLTLLTLLTLNLLVGQNNTATNKVYRPGKQIDYSWNAVTSNWDYSDSVRKIYNTEAAHVRTSRYSNSSIDKDTSIYDAAGYLIKKIEFKLNGSNYDTSSVDIFNYNEQYQIISHLYYLFNTSNNTIFSKAKTTSTYNSTGQLISDLYQQFTGGNFVNSAKSDYLYANTNIATPTNKIINYDWNETSNNFCKKDSTVNIVFQSWAGTPHNSNTKVYDIADTEGIQSLDSLYYDSFNNLTKRIGFTKVGNKWLYQYSETTSYVYDCNNTITQEITLGYGNGNYTLIQYGTKTIYSDFQPYIVSGILSNEAQNSTVSIFPNPNNGVFQITSAGNNLTSIDIFNALGTNVYSAKNLKEVSVKEINISGLPKGVYFIKFNDDAKTYTKKMVLN